MNTFIKIVWIAIGLVAANGCRVSSHTGSGAPATAPGASFAGNKFVGNFDSCSMAKQRAIWFGAETETAERISLVRKPVRSGSCALRITLHPGDRAGGIGRNRAEVNHNNKDREGAEIFVGYSMYIPHGYPGSNVIVTQWKELPPEGVSFNDHFKPNDPARSPTITLKYGQDERKQGLRLSYGRKGERLQQADVEIENDRWIDIVFNIRWSRSQRGFIEMWVDGKSVTKGKVYGANRFSPRADYVFKFGQYMGKADISAPGTIYFDEVRFGHSYDEAAPK